MNSWINLHALWQIVVIGLLAGAGLPAVFAFGLRVLALEGRHDTPAVRAVPAGGSDQMASEDASLLAGASALGIAVAAVCFAIVLAAIGYGIYLIVAGT